MGVHTRRRGDLLVDVGEDGVNGFRREHARELGVQVGGRVIEQGGHRLVGRPVFLGVVVARG
nr:hypothetical protein [Saccharopolyspora rosea]